MEFDQRYDKRYNSIDYEMEFEDMQQYVDLTKVGNCYPKLFCYSFSNIT